MNSILSRLNAVFAFSVSVLAVLTLCCFMSTAFRDRSLEIQLGADEGKLHVKKSREFHSLPKTDLGEFTYHLAANFTDMFDWNIKQLFLYLVAEYETSNNVVNQVVVWDKIIQRGDTSVLNLKNYLPKYRLFDDGHELRGKEVTLRLYWNLIPLAGHLPATRSKPSTFVFPLKYS